MAAPTFVHDLTTITDGETVTGWTILDGMIALDPDNKVQSANSVGFPAKLDTLCGGYFTMAGDVDLTGKHLFIWVFVAQPGAVAGFKYRLARHARQGFAERQDSLQHHRASHGFAPGPRIGVERSGADRGTARRTTFRDADLHANSFGR